MTAQLQKCRGDFERRDWTGLINTLGELEVADCQDPELLFFLGTAHDQLGQQELGIPAFGRALDLDPNSFGLRLSAVEALIHNKDWSLALNVLAGNREAAFQQLPLVQVLQSRCQLHLGDPRPAEQRLRELQRLEDMDPIALGIALVEANVLLGDLELAEHCLGVLVGFGAPQEELGLLRLMIYQKKAAPNLFSQINSVLQQQPAPSRRLILEAIKILRAQGHNDEAQRLALAAVESFGLAGYLAHHLFEILAEVGNLKLLQQNIDKRPLIVPPVSVDLYVAQCHYFRKEIKQAEEIFSRYPDEIVSMQFLGDVCRQRGQFDEAIKQRKKIYEATGLPESRFNLGLEMMGMGYWKEGWKCYESRFDVPDGYKPITVGQFHLVALKNSQDPPHGRRVLLFEEQGIGDVLMMSSMLHDLLKVARSVDIYVAERLVKLLQPSFGEVNFISSLDQNAINSYDSCYGFGSIGQFFRPDPTDCPGTPYLSIADGELAPWQDCLSPDQLNIGIAWKGGSSYGSRNSRSMELADLLPILKLQGVNWVNLQYRHDPTQLQELQDSEGVSITHFDGITEDLRATAALTKALDLVITVQQTALHIAGAVGTPAWVMLPAIPEWRYGYQGSSMPWYRTVELFRQPLEGQWNVVIDAVAGRLASKLQR